MKKFFICLSYITLILTAILLSYLIYLSFYPFQIVKLHRFTIVTPVVKRGELLTYELDFIKQRAFRADIRYYFVDGIIVQLEPSGIKRPVGEQEISQSRVVPTTIVPGVYKLRIELDYKITAWRTVSYVWESDTFKVL
jgi:hypothetical protein